MKKQKKIGKFALIALFFIIVAIYLLINLRFSRNVFYSTDWLSMWLLMFLYAVIPGVLAVVLLIRFETYAHRWISLAATVLCAICLFIIAAGPEAMLADKEWISTFAQYALVSSAPVLYCAASWGMEKDAWISLMPSLLYFLSFFVRYGILYGLAGILGLVRYFDFDFLFNNAPDPFILEMIIRIIMMSAVSFLWALLCMLVSRAAHKYISRLKEKKQIQKRKNKI